MKLASTQHRRVLLALAAAIGAVVALLSLWPSEPPPLQPLPILVLPAPTEPPPDVPLETGHKTPAQRAATAEEEAHREAVGHWRAQVAAALPALDRDCAPAEQTTMACEGSVCAFRHSWGVSSADPLVARFQRSPRAFVEHLAVSVTGLPATLTRCGQASANVPWRPMHLGPSGGATPGPRVHCHLMGFDWTEAPVNDRAFEHQAVRLCNGLAEQAGAPANYAVAPIHE